MTPTALRREGIQMSGVCHYFSILLKPAAPIPVTRHPGTFFSSPFQGKEIPKAIVFTLQVFSLQHSL